MRSLDDIIKEGLERVEFENHVALSGPARREFAASHGRAFALGNRHAEEWERSVHVQLAALMDRASAQEKVIAELRIDLAQALMLIKELRSKASIVPGAP